MTKFASSDAARMQHAGNKGNDVVLNSFSHLMGHSECRKVTINYKIIEIQFLAQKWGCLICTYYVSSWGEKIV